MKLNPFITNLDMFSDATVKLSSVTALDNTLPYIDLSTFSPFFIISCMLFFAIPATDCPSPVSYIASATTDWNINAKTIDNIKAANPTRIPTKPFLCPLNAPSTTSNTTSISINIINTSSL